MDEGMTGEHNRSDFQETDADVRAGGLRGEVSGRRSSIRQREKLNCGAVLMWSQPGKLQSLVALQVSQIEARGYMALYPHWGNH